MNDRDRIRSSLACIVGLSTLAIGLLWYRVSPWDLICSGCSFAVALFTTIYSLPRSWIAARWALVIWYVTMTILLEILALHTQVLGTVLRVLVALVGVVAFGVAARTLREIYRQVD